MSGVNFQGLIQGLAIFAFCTVFYSLARNSFSLRHIPTVGGPSFPILSFLGVYSYYYRHKETLQYGYQKYRGGTFKIALLDRWLVVVTGKKLIDEVSSYQDERMSMLHGEADLLGIAHTFGMQVWDPPYHVDLIRSTLTRHIGEMFGDIFDEIVTGFADILPTNEDEWVPVHAIDSMREIIARANGRAFVGLPSCRDPQYIDIAMNLAIDSGKMRKYLAVVPAFLKPAFARYMSSIDKRVIQAKSILEPIISQRIAALEYGSDAYPDKPEDMLMWIIEEAVERRQSVDTIIRNLLFVAFASVHTSSNVFTHVLYYIAADPMLAVPLCAEALAAFKQEGWTKAAVSKMRKMDSIFRESTRHSGIHTSTPTRKVMKPMYLSDGTFLPSDTVVITPMVPTHHDAEYYADPWTFDPWRFEKLRDADETGLKYQFVTTSSDFLVFGHGKQACPGRFFAATELKAMMAYLLLNYDVKFAQEGIRPTDRHSIMGISPDPTATVLFRKRRTTSDEVSG